MIRLCLSILATIVGTSIVPLLLLAGTFDPIWQWASTSFIHGPYRFLILTPFVFLWVTSSLAEGDPYKGNVCHIRVLVSAVLRGFFIGLVWFFVVAADLWNRSPDFSLLLCLFSVMLLIIPFRPGHLLAGWASRFMVRSPMSRRHIVHWSQCLMIRDVRVFSPGSGFLNYLYRPLFWWAHVLSRLISMPFWRAALGGGPPSTVFLHSVELQSDLVCKRILLLCELPRCTESEHELVALIDDLYDLLSCECSLRSLLNSGYSGSVSRETFDRVQSVWLFLIGHGLFDDSYPGRLDQWNVLINEALEAVDFSTKPSMVNFSSQLLRMQREDDLLALYDAAADELRDVNEKRFIARDQDFLRAYVLHRLQQADLLTWVSDLAKTFDDHPVDGQAGFELPRVAALHGQIKSAIYDTSEAKLIEREHAQATKRSRKLFRTGSNDESQTLRRGRFAHGGLGALASPAGIFSWLFGGLVFFLSIALWFYAAFAELIPDLEDRFRGFAFALNETGIDIVTSDPVRGTIYGGSGDLGLQVIAPSTFSVHTEQSGPDSTGPQAGTINDLVVDDGSGKLLASVSNFGNGVDLRCGFDDWTVLIDANVCELPDPNDFSDAITLPDGDLILGYLHNLFHYDSQLRKLTLLDVSLENLGHICEIESCGDSLWILGSNALGRFDLIGSLPSGSPEIRSELDQPVQIECHSDRILARTLSNSLYLLGDDQLQIPILTGRQWPELEQSRILHAGFSFDGGALCLVLDASLWQQVGLRNERTGLWKRTPPILGFDTSSITPIVSPDGNAVLGASSDGKLLACFSGDDTSETLEVVSLFEDWKLRSLTSNATDWHALLAKDDQTEVLTGSWMKLLSELPVSEGAVVPFSSLSLVSRRRIDLEDALVDVQPLPGSEGDVLRFLDRSGRFVDYDLKTRSPMGDSIQLLDHDGRPFNGVLSFALGEDSMFILDEQSVLFSFPLVPSPESAEVGEGDLPVLKSKDFGIEFGTRRLNAGRIEAMYDVQNGFELIDDNGSVWRYSRDSGWIHENVRSETSFLMKGETIRRSADNRLLGLDDSGRLRERSTIGWTPVLDEKFDAIAPSDTGALLVDETGSHFLLSSDGSLDSIWTSPSGDELKRPVHDACLIVNSGQFENQILFADSLGVILYDPLRRTWKRVFENDEVSSSIRLHNGADRVWIIDRSLGFIALWMDGLVQVLTTDAVDISEVVLGRILAVMQDGSVWEYSEDGTSRFLLPAVTCADSNQFDSITIDKNRIYAVDGNQILTTDKAGIVTDFDTDLVGVSDIASLAGNLYLLNDTRSLYQINLDTGLQTIVTPSSWTGVRRLVQFEESILLFGNDGECAVLEPNKPLQILLTGGCSDLKDVQLDPKSPFLELNGTVILATDSGPVLWSGTSQDLVPLDGDNPLIKRFFRTNTKAYAIGIDDQLYDIDESSCRLISTRSTQAILTGPDGDLQLTVDGLIDIRNNSLKYGGGDYPESEIIGARIVRQRLYLVDALGNVYEYSSRSWRYEKIISSVVSNQANVLSVHALGDEQLLIIHDKSNGNASTIDVVDPVRKTRDSLQSVTSFALDQDSDGVVAMTLDGKIHSRTDDAWVVIFAPKINDTGSRLVDSLPLDDGWIVRDTDGILSSVRLGKGVTRLALGTARTAKQIIPFGSKAVVVDDAGGLHGFDLVNGRPLGRLFDPGTTLSVAASAYGLLLSVKGTENSLRVSDPLAGNTMWPGTGVQYPGDQPVDVRSTLDGSGLFVLDKKGILYLYTWNDHRWSRRFGIGREVDKGRILIKSNGQPLITVPGAVIESGWETVISKNTMAVEDFDHIIWWISPEGSLVRDRRTFSRSRWTDNSLPAGSESCLSAPLDQVTVHVTDQSRLMLFPDIGVIEVEDRLHFVKRPPNSLVPTAVHDVSIAYGTGSFLLEHSDGRIEFFQPKSLQSMFSDDRLQCHLMDVDSDGVWLVLSGEPLLKSLARLVPPSRGTELEFDVIDFELPPDPLMGALIYGPPKSDGRIRVAVMPDGETSVFLPEFQPRTISVLPPFSGNPAVASIRVGAHGDLIQIVQSNQDRVVVLYLDSSGEVVDRVTWDESGWRDSTENIKPAQLSEDSIGLVSTVSGKTSILDPKTNLLWSLKTNGDLDSVFLIQAPFTLSEKGLGLVTLTLKSGSPFGAPIENQTFTEKFSRTFVTPVLGPIPLEVQKKLLSTDVWANLGASPQLIASAEILEPIDSSSTDWMDQFMNGLAFESGMKRDDTITLLLVDGDTECQASLSLQTNRLIWAQPEAVRPRDTAIGFQPPTLSGSYLLLRGEPSLDDLDLKLGLSRRMQPLDLNVTQSGKVFSRLVSGDFVHVDTGEKVSSADQRLGGIPTGTKGPWLYSSDGGNISRRIPGLGTIRLGDISPGSSFLCDGLRDVPGSIMPVQNNAWLRIDPSGTLWVHDFDGSKEPFPIKTGLRPEVTIALEKGSNGKTVVLFNGKDQLIPLTDLVTLTDWSPGQAVDQMIDGTWRRGQFVSENSSQPSLLVRDSLGTEMPVQLDQGRLDFDVPLEVSRTGEQFMVLVETVMGPRARPLRSLLDGQVDPLVLWEPIPAVPQRGIVSFPGGRIVLNEAGASLEVSDSSDNRFYASSFAPMELDRLIDATTRSGVLFGITRNGWLIRRDLISGNGARIGATSTQWSAIESDGQRIEVITSDGRVAALSPDDSISWIDSSDSLFGSGRNRWTPDDYSSGLRPGEDGLGFSFIVPDGKIPINWQPDKGSFDIQTISDRLLDSPLHDPNVLGRFGRDVLLETNYGPIVVEVSQASVSTPRSEQRFIPPPQRLFTDDGAMSIQNGLQNDNSIRLHGVDQFSSQGFLDRGDIDISWDIQRGRMPYARPQGVEMARDADDLIRFIHSGASLQIISDNRNLVFHPKGDRFSVRDHEINSDDLLMLDFSDSIYAWKRNGFVETEKDAIDNARSLRDKRIGRSGDGPAALSWSATSASKPLRFALSSRTGSVGVLDSHEVLFDGSGFLFDRPDQIALVSGSVITRSGDLILDMGINGRLTDAMVIGRSSQPLEACRLDGLQGIRVVTPAGRSLAIVDPDPSKWTVSQYPRYRHADQIDLKRNSDDVTYRQQSHDSRELTIEWHPESVDSVPRIIRERQGVFEHDQITDIAILRGIAGRAEVLSFTYPEGIGVRTLESNRLLDVLPLDGSTSLGLRSDAQGVGLALDSGWFSVAAMLPLRLNDPVDDSIFEIHSRDRGDWYLQLQQDARVLPFDRSGMSLFSNPGGGWLPGDELFGIGLTFENYNLVLASESSIQDGLGNTLLSIDHAQEPPVTIRSQTASDGLFFDYEGSSGPLVHLSADGEIDFLESTPLPSPKPRFEQNIGLRFDAGLPRLEIAKAFEDFHPVSEVPMSFNNGLAIDACTNMSRLPDGRMLIVTSAGLKVMPVGSTRLMDEIAIRTDTPGLFAEGASFVESTEGKLFLDFDSMEFPIRTQGNIAGVGVPSISDPSNFTLLHSDGDWSFRSYLDGVRVLRPDWGLDHPLSESFRRGQFLFDHVEGIGHDVIGLWVETSLGIDRIKEGRLIPSERFQHLQDSSLESIEESEPSRVFRFEVGKKHVEIDGEHLRIDGEIRHSFEKNPHIVRIDDRLWIVEPGTSRPVRWLRLDPKWF